MVEEKKDYIVIDFTGLFKAIWKKIIIVLLVGVIGAGIGAGYGYYEKKTTPFVPMYTSTVRMYMTGDVSSQKPLIYYELMCGKKVLDQVKVDLQLNMTNTELKNCIRRGNVTGTTLFYIQVTFPDAQYAKEILDDLVRLTNAYAFDVFALAAPVIYERPQVPVKASNAPTNNTLRYGVFGGAAGVALAIIVIIFWFLADKKIRTLAKAESCSEVVTYGVRMKGKNEKIAYLNAKAISNFYARLCVTNREAKVISFYSMNSKKAYSYVKQLEGFLAEQGKNVLCIGADAISQMGSEDVGDSAHYLEDYLTGKAEDWKSIVVKSDAGDEILLAKDYSNTAELLNTQTFIDLLEWIKAEYDYVLICPLPMSIKPDARCFISLSDLNLADIELNRTTVNDMKDLLREFGGMGNLNGLILDNASYSRRSHFKKEFGKFIGV